MFEKMLTLKALDAELDALGVPDDTREWLLKGENGNRVWNAIQEVGNVNVKTGWKTTEFWMAVLSGAGTVVGALTGVIPPQTAAYITAGISAAYGFVRAITKMSSPTAEPDAPPATKP